ENKQEEAGIVNEEPTKDVQKEWLNETGSDDPIDPDESTFSAGAMSWMTRPRKNRMQMASDNYWSILQQIVSEQKPAGFNSLMRIQKGNAQPLLLTQPDENQRLQSETARLRAHIAKLMAPQQSPAQRNLMPLAQLSVQAQNAGGCPSGAHLQMCSFHGHCTHNDASCQAQCPNIAAPSDAAANAGHCFFSGMPVHPTEQWDRPCPHCHQIQVHRATACPNQKLTNSEVLHAVNNDVGIIETLPFLLATVLQWLEFISNGTIQATPINKLLLEGKPSSPAVDAVEQASLRGCCLSTANNGNQCSNTVGDHPATAISCPNQFHNCGGKCFWRDLTDHLTLATSGITDHTDQLTPVTQPITDFQSPHNPMSQNTPKMQ
uniref:Uncharacterized protein n=1 Tax=Romanomermis culicivorax TaxID=13658 RepID=A0A915INI5_ROMCU